MRPLLLTLALDDASQEHFDALRARHFPAGRNHLAAHITMFHALPGEQEERWRQDVREAAGRPPLDVAVTGLRAFGNATVYLLESAALLQLRAGLATRWLDVLTAQDRQGFTPHLTVQNKVDAVTARALLGDLSASFEPRRVVGTALLLWRYLGGPWQLVERCPFSSARHSLRADGMPCSDSGTFQGGPRGQ